MGTTSQLSERYEILDELGKGSYGKVYRVRRKQCTKEEKPERSDDVFVLKQVNLAGMNERDREDTLNEARVMSKCDHFNIIRYYESFIENELLNIIMEYASGGDLGQKITAQQDVPFKEELLWNYLIQISQGLKYLHDQRILHRDIKPQNIYLDHENNIKIGDMGLGRILGPQTNFAHTGVGTPLYFSPELCEEHPYNHKSDIWSFGCLMYEMAALRPPFVASNQIALARRIVGEQPRDLPSIYSKEFAFLVTKMLEKDPSRRPDINDILNYSAVRIRIQRAKLRHKELKLHEQYLQLERNLQHEYNSKMEQLNRDMASREEALLQREQDMKRREDDLESQEKELLEWQKVLEQKELDVESRIKKMDSHSPNALPTDVSEKIDTSGTRMEVLESKPDASPPRPEWMLTKEELFFRFENFCDDVGKHLVSPRNIIGERRRPKSAPSTPQRMPRTLRGREIRRKMMTPSPKRRHNAFELGGTSPNRPSKIKLKKEDHVIHRKGRSPTKVQRNPSSDDQLFQPKGRQIFKSRFLSSYDLDFAVNDMEEMSHFETFFQWTRQRGTSWDNDGQVELSVHSASMLIVFQTNDEGSSVDRVSVIFKGDERFTRLSTLQPFRMQGRHPVRRNLQRYMIEVPMSLTRSRLITKVKIKFDHPSQVEQVIVLRFEPKLLEMAGAPGKASVTPFADQQVISKPIATSPYRKNPAIKVPRKREVRRQLFKESDSSGEDNDDNIGQVSRYMNKSDILATPKRRGSQVNDGFLSPPFLSPRSVSNPVTPIRNRDERSHQRHPNGPLSPDMVAKLLHLIKVKHSPARQKRNSVEEDSSVHSGSIENGMDSRKKTLVKHETHSSLVLTSISSDESDAAETLKQLRAQMRKEESRHIETFE